MKKIIISVTNDLSTDQRVNKVAASLSKIGLSVLLVGIHSNKSFDDQFKIKRFKLYNKKGIFFYLEYNIKLFFFLINSDFNILLSNDVDTIVPNLLVSKIKNKPLVYDSHELFSEVPELISRPVRKKVWKMVEYFCLPKLNFSYTVSDSIADYYKTNHGIQMSVIRNFPLKKPVSNNKQPNKRKIIIYQGAVNKDRGIELMILSMSYVDATLIIVGNGDEINRLKDLAKENNLEDKVSFMGHVNFNKLHEITQSADLGLSFEEDSCLAYRYSLPNKIFDYINAEIPVLVSNLPEYKKILNRYNFCNILISRNPKVVASQINKILAKDKIQYANEIKKAKRKFCWDSEELNLFKLFEKISF